jgi:hypothetical protein
MAEQRPESRQIDALWQSFVVPTTQAPPLLVHLPSLRQSAVPLHVTASPPASVVNDNNPCTFEVCNTFSGVCVFQALANCNPSPKCSSNLDCNDNNVCTSDLCNTSNGTCLNAAIAGCNPNQQCKVDGDCDDGNKCTADVCNAFNSSCVHVTLAGCTP